MYICPVRAEWFNANRRMDGQRDMTKPLVVFRHFSNRSKIIFFFLLRLEDKLLQHELTQIILTKPTRYPAHMLSCVIHLRNNVVVKAKRLICPCS